MNRDPGLQPERTLMSWQRTLILLVVVGLLFLRGPLVPEATAIPEIPLPMRVAMLVVTLTMAAVLGLHLRSRWSGFGNGVRDPETGEPPLYLVSPWAMIALCATTLLLSVVLIVTALAGT